MSLKEIKELYINTTKKIDPYFNTKSLSYNAKLEKKILELIRKRESDKIKQLEEVLNKYYLLDEFSQESIKNPIAFISNLDIYYAEIQESPKYFLG